MESIEAYKPGGFHPVHYGDVFRERYEIVRKLGAGRFATVWLVQDQRTQTYVVMKVGMADSEADDQSDMQIEADILQSLPSPSSHPGRSRVPLLVDSFVHTGPNGRHPCLVLPVLGQSLQGFLEKDVSLTLPVARRIAHQLVSAVAFLHHNQILHRDIQLGNVMLVLVANDRSEIGMSSKKFDSLSIEEINADCVENASDKYPPVVLIENADNSPSVPKYIAQDFALKEELNLEQGSAIDIVLGDYGASSTIANANDKREAYSPTLRPPELVLDCPADESITMAADVWNLALIVYKLITGNNLWSSWFFDDAQLLCDITRRLGPMPEEFRSRWTEKDSESCDESIDETGKLLDDDEEEPEQELLEPALLASKPFAMKDTEAKAFSDWMKKSLTWLPEDRASAKQLLEHEWLKNDWDGLHAT